MGRIPLMKMVPKTTLVSYFLFDLYQIFNFIREWSDPVSPDGAYRKYKAKNFLP